MLVDRTADPHREMLGPPLSAETPPAATTRPGRRLLAPLMALSLAAAACGTANATPGPVESAPSGALIPDSFITPDTDGAAASDEVASARPVEFVPISIDEILQAAVAAVDADLWAAGYFGQCPTPESLGLDPLSSDAISGPAEVTGARVCSWQSMGDNGVVVASLDRLDVLGDEAQYFVALGQDPNEDWRLATDSERASLQAPGLSDDAIFLNDHLIPSGSRDHAGA